MVSIDSAEQLYRYDLHGDSSSIWRGSAAERTEPPGSPRRPSPRAVTVMSWWQPLKNRDDACIYVLCVVSFR
jgi:hypothetical protein